MFLGAFLTSLGQAQSGRGGEWITHSGDPQRAAWQKNETRISKERMKEFRLLWKLKLDNQTRALHSLTAPLIVNSLYRDLAVIAGTSDTIYALDADLGGVVWKSTSITRRTGRRTRMRLGFVREDYSRRPSLLRRSPSAGPGGLVNHSRRQRQAADSIDLRHFERRFPPSIRPKRWLGIGAAGEVHAPERQAVQLEPRR
jgi:hypothetical protein